MNHIPSFWMCIMNHNTQKDGMWFTQTFIICDAVMAIWKDQDMKSLFWSWTNSSFLKSKC